MFTSTIFSAPNKIVNLPFKLSILLLVSTLISASPLNHQTTSASPISISLPLPLASVPQPVTITKNTNTNNNNNDVIGYIVLPYPGIDQRADMTAAAQAPTAPLFSLLGPGPGAVPPATAFGGLGRTYRRFRPGVYNPLYYNPYGVFPGYGIYGYNPRIPLFNFLG